MKSLRKLLMLGALTATVAVVPGVFAQEDTFGLSEADYAIFSEANANSAAADAFSYQFTTTVEVSSGGDGGTIDVSGSGSAGADGFSLDVSGTIEDGSSSQDAALDVRVVEDSLYLRLGGEDQVWFGGTADEITGLITNFSSTLMGGMGSQMPQMDATQIAGGDMSGLMAQPGVAEAMTALNDLDISEFVSIERASDDGDVAAFTTTVDVAGLFASPELSQVFGAAMMSQMGGSTSGAEMSDEQLAQMGQMVGSMFSGAEITLDQYINTEEAIVERAVLTIDFPLSGISGSGSDTLNIVFDISLRDFGVEVPVEAPEDFQPFSEIMSGFMGGMSGMSS